MHKFISNDKTLINGIPKTKRSTETALDLLNFEETLHRTLGIQWDTNTDNFCYNVRMKSQDLTRRAILSTVASTFDPLGLIAPIIITGKSILQKCCQLKLDWDDELPTELRNEWITWSNSLEHLETITFPRCYVTPDMDKITNAELHSFSDASTDAYGAAIYHI